MNLKALLAQPEWQACLNSLNGCLQDECLDQLPPEQRTLIAGLRDSINKNLAVQPPLDQVPAALEAASSLNYLQRVLADMASFTQQVLASLKQFQGAAATSTNSLTELQAKIDGGEFIARAAHEQAVQEAAQLAARSAGPAAVAAYKEACARLESRRTAFTAYSLPVPPDALLEGEDAAVETLRTTAQARVAELAPFNLSLNELPGDMLWSSAETYADRLAVIKAARVAATPAGPPKNPLGAPTAAPGTPVKTRALAAV